MNLPERRRRAGQWLSLPLGGLLALVVGGLIPWDEQTIAPGVLETAALDPEATLRALAEAKSTSTPEPTAKGTIAAGQTLGGIFGGIGIDGVEAHRMAAAAAAHLDLRQLRPGVDWAAYTGEGEAVDRFDLRLPDRGELSLERVAGEWVGQFLPFVRESRFRSIRGTLDGSLEQSIARAGGDPALAYMMADVLQWDLDFTRDLRTGDEFAVVFEESLVDGSLRGPDRIVGLRYGRAGVEGQWEAFDFQGRGYYDAEGRPLQKMFLRSPLPYSRVTSRFSNRRFHPVLKAFRPHYGVDYGAPVGTPVRATASGTVTLAGWNGGGGRTVRLRHPNQYETNYLHLSGFAKGVRTGARVRQGDIVGYVGSSGLATGPHLDYRVRHRGSWIDPLSLASVPAEPLSRQHLADFRRVQGAIVSSLESGAPYEVPVTVADAATSRQVAALETPSRPR